MATFMRSADVDEISAHSGREPLESMLFLYAESTRIWTVEIAERPAAMFGVFHQDRHGVPWMLGTDGLEKASWWVLRSSRQWVPILGQGCDYLTNVVDCRNSVHIRWIQWAGFRITARIPEFGYEQRPFYKFHWRNV